MTEKEICSDAGEPPVIDEQCHAANLYRRPSCGRLIARAAGISIAAWNTKPRSALMHRYLEPASRLERSCWSHHDAYIYVGLPNHLEEEGREGARELLIAIIGCKIAWGIIDGALYLVGQLFDRGRKRRVGRWCARARG